MGVDTKIYSNHNLKIPNKSEDVVEFLLQSWKEKGMLYNNYEVDENDKTSDIDNFNIIINPKLIEFEFNRYNQITLGTNFMFTMNMRLHKNTICITPYGIGRNATNMIVEFMDEPFGIYADDPVGFDERKKNWSLFKSFLSNVTSAIGSNKHLYINDLHFQGIEDMATDGATLDEMINKAKTVVNQCETKEQFVNDHTWLRPDGIRNVNSDIWFYRKK